MGTSVQNSDHRTLFWMDEGDGYKLLKHAFIKWEKARHGNTD